jgi:hypothetical protein
MVNRTSLFRHGALRGPHAGGEWVDVIVVEARPRVGGRVLTQYPDPGEDILGKTRKAAAVLSWFFVK